MIELATKEDLPSLPRPWNYEFFVKEVSEEEIGSPLVNLGQPCPLRLSGFSSLTDTPSCSSRRSRSSRSRRTKTKGFQHQGYHQDSRSRSCDILEETDNDILASCDELDEDESDL